MGYRTRALSYRGVMGYWTGALSYRGVMGYWTGALSCQRCDGIQDWSIVLPEV